ncbi:MAG: flavodoxin family protein [Candidatus Bathyarchaeota archaeon]|nr:flavodoxin family protein [Candidatus Bathyarchaeota archaeon]
MKSLIVYDSVHGNTEKIARAIGEAITGEAQVLHVEKVNPSEITTYNLLIIGSPTHGGRPTPAMREFLSKAPALNGATVAAFDTRIPMKWVRIFGYAAGRIANILKRKGGKLIVPPEAFFVMGTEGPLKEGEIEHAASWAKEIEKKVPM